MKSSEYLAALEAMNEVRTTEEAARFDRRLVDRFRGQQGLDDLRNSLAKHCDALKAWRAQGARMTSTEYIATLDEIGALRTDEEAARFDQRLVDRFRGQPGLEDLRSAVVNHRDALAAVRANGN